MRAINISTAVFAKVWSLRQEGEETEDAILRRLLGVADDQLEHSTQNRDTAGKGAGGVNVPEFGVHFPESFEIFRVYKGTEYRARATGGSWLLLNDNNRYASLNRLSKAVGAGSENSWNNWKYERDDGFAELINELRDPSKVQSRSPKLIVEPGSSLELI